MSEITWYCDACNADCENFGVILIYSEDIDNSKAYISMKGYNPIDLITPYTTLWEVYCDNCFGYGVPRQYELSTACIRTYKELCFVLSILLEKDWIQYTDFYRVTNALHLGGAWGGKSRTSLSKWDHIKPTRLGGQT